MFNDMTLDGFMVGLCCDDNISLWMEGAGIAGRSDLLMYNFMNTEGLVAFVVEEFVSSMTSFYRSEEYRGVSCREDYDVVG